MDKRIITNIIKCLNIKQNNWWHDINDDMILYDVMQDIEHLRENPTEYHYNATFMNIIDAYDYIDNEFRYYNIIEVNNELSKCVSNRTLPKSIITEINRVQEYHKIIYNNARRAAICYLTDICQEYLSDKISGNAIRYVIDDKPDIYPYYPLETIKLMYEPVMYTKVISSIIDIINDFDETISEWTLVGER